MPATWKSRQVTRWTGGSKSKGAPRASFLAEAGAPNWHADAECRDAPDPDLWFPSARESSAPAKAVCRSCPVVRECLRWALETDQTDGVWGGMDEDERHYMKTGRRRRHRAEREAA